MPFSAELPRRLLIVKQMMNHGIEHGTKRGELNRLCSILALDGAIENFLYTVVTELGGSLKPTKQDTFYDVLTAANEAAIKATKEFLPLIGEIKALHETRNGVQHNATIPDVSTVQRYIVYCSDFLARTFTLCFHVSIEELHLADAIRTDKLRAILTVAEDESNKKNYEGSIMSSAHAFAFLQRIQRIIQESDRWRREVDGSARYRISQITNGLLCEDRHKHAKDELGRLLDSIVLETEYLRDRIEILSLGVNVQEYNYFRQKAPQVVLMMDKSPRYNMTGEKYDKHDCRIIFNFVYNLVLSWENSLPEETIVL
jgi:hypothetical protein